MKYQTGSKSLSCALVINRLSLEFWGYLFEIIVSDVFIGLQEIEQS